MALPIEQLYKARDFLNLKNISANHVELSFKNPVIAMLAVGRALRSDFSNFALGKHCDYGILER